jgi:hypothetical protein
VSTKTSGRVHGDFFAGDFIHFSGKLVVLVCLLSQLFPLFVKHWAAVSHSGSRIPRVQTAEVTIPYDDVSQPKCLQC